ncbi:uncharacterized protein LOC119659018 [Hermetia illucens]|uniref:uncharacterized protein LOC119659018 n=1 Tax=Hermetia illucens TaxID=343691 RepID=UPI0018CC229A|nr:uncharacterized protein LOC119659018 [Hermetia illucens]
MQLVLMRIHCRVSTVLHLHLRSEIGTECCDLNHVRLCDNFLNGTGHDRVKHKNRFILETNLRHRIPNQLGMFDNSQQTSALHYDQLQSIVLSIYSEKCFNPSRSYSPGTEGTLGSGLKIKKRTQSYAAK